MIRLIDRYVVIQEAPLVNVEALYASQSGLGAALLQGGQPVAYASRALTPTETRYELEVEKVVASVGPVFIARNIRSFLLTTLSVAA